MREKKRYVTLKIERDGEALDGFKAKRLLSQSVLDVLGQAGAAEAAFSVKAFDAETQRAVVKCSTKSLERVIAALALKRFFDGKSVALRVEKLAGSYSPSGFKSGKKQSA